MTLLKILEDRILKDGKILPGNVLKVDSFLNHQMDVELLVKAGVETHNYEPTAKDMMRILNNSDIYIFRSLRQS